MRVDREIGTVRLRQRQILISMVLALVLVPFSHGWSQDQASENQDYLQDDRAAHRTGAEDSRNDSPQSEFPRRQSRESLNPEKTETQDTRNSTRGERYDSTDSMPSKDTAERDRNALESDSDAASRRSKDQSPVRQSRASQAPRRTQRTEFQKLVLDTIGTELPIFGHDLFEGVPTTFAPIDRVPVPADYMIGPGDELQIRLWGQVEANHKVVVDRNGNVFVPQVGQVPVAGVRADRISGVLKGAVGRYFSNFELSATLGQLRSIQIFVVGQARRPGSYTVSSLSTLVNALFASGGPSPRGSMRRIQLKRNDTLVTELDLYDLLLRGEKSKDVALRSGDVIFIPPVGSVVALAGSVNSPAIFETRGETTLDSLLSLAGGLTANASRTKIAVERVIDGKSRQVREFPLEGAGLSATIENGDIVRVLPLSPRIAQQVSLKGNVANPGRHEWTPGMRVSDLISNWQDLVTADYWRSKNRPEQTTDVRADVRRATTEINWNYAVIERLDQNDLTTRLIPFNLAFALKKDAKNDLELQPGDSIRIFSHSDLPVPARDRTRFVYLEGEFVNAGVYRVEPGETLRELVARVGGLTPQAYTFGATFTRESVRKEQQAALDTFFSEYQRDLEREQARLAHDPRDGDSQQVERELETQRHRLENLRAVKAAGRIVLRIPEGVSGPQDFPNIELEDGDKLLVPQRSSTVFVAGAVNNRNSYIYQPGATLSDYLSWAGGARREADSDNILLIRSDGSVLSERQANKGFTRHGLRRTKLLPGDTIYVPEKPLSVSVVRRLKDWSQVLSQFALGAAAVKVLQ